MYLIAINTYKAILLDRGFLSYQFVSKVMNDTGEMLRCIRQNRQMIGVTLNRRLNPSNRPILSDLIQKCIIPLVSVQQNLDLLTCDDFTIGYKSIDIQQKILSLENIFKISQRPTVDTLCINGIIDFVSMMKYFYVNTNTIREKMKYSDGLINILNGHDKMINLYNDKLVESLMNTVDIGLKKICGKVRADEVTIREQTNLLNKEMIDLRSSLERCFVNDEPDVGAWQRDEQNLKEQYHGIKNKLLSTQNNRIRTL